jgi:predicted NUDIX family NTP pyrophosphohydrolase
MTKKPAKLSAGLLLYRRRQRAIEFLLVHPGGPFWRNKDAGAWTIPKGEAAAGEDLLATARREFVEELGLAAPTDGPFRALTPVKQKAGKLVHAWLVEGDVDPATIRSNTFTIEWPPRSGKQAEFPEIDRAEFFSLDVARTKINPAQIPLLDEAERLLSR